MSWLTELEQFTHDLINRVGITEPTLHEEAYEKLLYQLYDRITVSMIAMLPQSQQIEVQKMMDTNFDAELFYRYCQDKIEKLDEKLDDVMLDFAEEYLKRMREPLPS